MIVKNIERVPQKTVIAFEKLKGRTATISDAMGRTGYMSAEIKPIFESARIVGPAVTVRCPAGGNLVLHKAIDISQVGDVIVVDAQGHKDTAVWGMIMSLSSMQKRIKGIVIDGAVRDVEEIRRVCFPVFSKAICGRGPHKAELGAVNVPIQCGGVPIFPGDLVIGDCDGVVVVPKNACESVLEKTKSIIKEENRMKSELRKGKPHAVIFEFVKDASMKAKGFKIES